MWFSKLQSVVNTATYGAEATAGRTAIEQMKSNKLTLQYMGVRVLGPSILFCDNKTVVNASSVPEARLLEVCPVPLPDDNRETGCPEDGTGGIPGWFGIQV